MVALMVEFQLNKQRLLFFSGAKQYTQELECNRDVQAQESL